MLADLVEYRMLYIEKNNLLKIKSHDYGNLVTWLLSYTLSISIIMSIWDP